MRLRFVPAHPGAVAFIGAVCVRSGDVVDVSDEWAARIGAAYSGEQGGPCLIPVGRSAVEAVADFIEAVSTPTPHNPETPPAAAADESAPVRRGRGRPRKSA